MIPKVVHVNLLRERIFGRPGRGNHANHVRIKSKYTLDFIFTWFDKFWEYGGNIVKVVYEEIKFGNL